MNCEALAFVAAQLHAAKCVQRYKCSEIAQALKDTLLFVCSFRNFRKYTFDSLFQIYCQKSIASYEHTTNWSVIWHDFDVIEYCSRREEERVERTKDNRIVAAKES